MPSVLTIPGAMSSGVLPGQEVSSGAVPSCSCAWALENVRSSNKATIANQTTLYLVLPHHTNKRRMSKPFHDVAEGLHSRIGSPEFTMFEHI